MGPVLPNLLLVAPAYFHLFHLKAINHAEHVVLQDAYEMATKCADDILEQALSIDDTCLNDLKTLGFYGNEVFHTPTSFVAFMIDELTQALNSSGDTPALQNVLQDTLTAYRKLKYQLGLCA